MNAAPPSTVSAIGEKRYWPQLDGLRAVAFLLVFISHQGPMENLPPEGPGRIVGEAVNKVVSWGWSGVDLFYVLSGFLITAILCAERQRTGGVSFRAFFIRRSLRIWPLHYTVILLSCFAAPVWGLWGVDFGTQVWSDMMRHYAGWFAVFLGNFPVAFREAAGLSPMLAIMWSVCMEEQFYMFWGSAMKIFSSLKAAVIILLAALAAGLAARGWLQPDSKSHLIYYYNTISHTDPFVIGCLASLINQRVAHAAVLMQRHAAVFTLAGLAVVLGLVWKAPSIFANTAFNIPLFTILSLGWAALLVGTLGCGLAAAPLKNRMLVHLGQRTYAMYACQYLGILAATALTDRMGGHSLPSTWLLRLGVGFLVTYLCAHLSWILIELRFLRIRHRYAIVKSGLDIAADGN